MGLLKNEGTKTTGACWDSEVFVTYSHKGR